MFTGAGVVSCSDPAARLA